ncbi:hypothetical protein GUJ93_ZPchr0013g34110 [Zizania palustris]|uniref:Uncharacterized protein n=1 Tax=Zizania palustris TaxID=103762 RepID=A0A8J5WR18_ZIZPA|nr:hypothetical protein GUJ93_ZPchr0013g34110 [Zizania palustris]
MATDGSAAMLSPMEDVLKEVLQGMQELHRSNQEMHESINRNNHRMDDLLQQAQDFAICWLEQGLGEVLPTGTSHAGSQGNPHHRMPTPLPGNLPLSGRHNSIALWYHKLNFLTFDGTIDPLPSLNRCDQFFHG